jgi:hypothetical protein
MILSYVNSHVQAISDDFSTGVREYDSWAITDRGSGTGNLTVRNGTRRHAVANRRVLRMRRAHGWQNGPTDKEEGEQIKTISHDRACHSTAQNPGEPLIHADEH